MTEGWSGENYLVLYSREESEVLTSSYGIDKALPGYLLIGLRVWDDFIIINTRDGTMATVPCVPMIQQYVAPFQMPDISAGLTADPRFAGKIRWFVKPLVFGGNPQDTSNVTWITQAQHIDAVKWFNDLYRQLASQQ